MSRTKPSLKNVINLRWLHVFALIIILVFTLSACEPETDESQSESRNPVTGTISPNSPNSIDESTTSESSAPPSIPIQGDLVDVVSVTDGDTIKVRIGSKTKTIRFIGIDTPETKDPRKPVQCFGQEASNKMKELVENKQVILEGDPSQGELDKYGRLLRFVFLPDGTNVNLKMISDGYAQEYTYNLPYKYQSEFKAAQRDADANNRGLWSPTTCNGDTNQAVAGESSSAPSHSEAQPTCHSEAKPTCHSEAKPKNLNAYASA